MNWRDRFHDARNRRSRRTGRVLIVLEFEAMTNLGADLQELLDAANESAAVRAELAVRTAERDALQAKANNAIAADDGDQAVLVKVSEFAAARRGQAAVQVDPDASEPPAGLVVDAAK